MQWQDFSVTRPEMHRQLRKRQDLGEEERGEEVTTALYVIGGMAWLIIGMHFAQEWDVAAVIWPLCGLIDLLVWLSLDLPEIIARRRENKKPVGKLVQLKDGHGWVEEPVLPDHPVDYIG